MSPIADNLLTIVEEKTNEYRQFDDAATSAKPDPNRWSIKEVIGHLVDSAVNNHQRFVRAQEVEAFQFPGYAQNHWVACQDYNQVEWTELLDLWRLTNRHLAHVIRRVPQESLAVTCHIGDYEPVTLQFLIEDYVVHLNHHLQKIDERMSRVESV